VAIPVVDVSPYLSGKDKQGVARQVAEACETSGFFAVSGHGVDAALIGEMYDVSRRFFELPLEEKRRCAPPSLDLHRGYRPSGVDALAASLDEETPPDIVEVFVYNRLGDPGVDDPARYPPELAGYFTPNVWPERPAEFRDVWLAYYRRLEQLAASLMRLCALALDLPEGWFDDKVDNHSTNLIVNYYPPQERPPKPGQLRRGAHTDWGGLTILYQDDKPGGLQVQDRRTGEWLDVGAVAGTYVVNLGDLMAQWTNDRWVSTLHRVVNPPREEASTYRISIPFFHQPNLDALVECLPTCTSPSNPPKYAPVASGEWFVRKSSKSVVAA
jgi:isopenicillin N synthase-like dioxygenase